MNFYFPGLAPCPLCGNPAVYSKPYNCGGLNDMGAVIRCTECKLIILGREGENLSGILARWNRRAHRSSFSFDLLRAANVARLPTFRNRLGQPAHSEADGSDWSDAEWLQAVTGELGELANEMKKRLRGDYADLPDAVIRHKLASEVADVQIYLDLLAFRLGIDLGRATIEKFNEVSLRVRSPVWIETETVEITIGKTPGAAGKGR